MSKKIPALLKPIQPYILRADELEAKAPHVAFYCRTYAVQEGLPLISAGAKDKSEAEQYLMDLMDQLETAKRALNPNPEEGRATVELFALKMFKKADDEDRKGVQTATIAKLFYAASILMQCTKQFGDISEDIAEKMKYAKWRAAEISKAVKNPEINSNSNVSNDQKHEEDLSFPQGNSTEVSSGRFEEKKISTQPTPPEKTN